MLDELSLPLRWDLVREDAITQGADWVRYIDLYYDDEALGTEVLWEPAGATARMHIKADYGGAVALELTTENGRLRIGDGHTLTLWLTAAATAGVADWGLGVYDLEIVDAASAVIRVYHGRVALSREVTS